jgi:hypothetical protein
MATTITVTGRSILLPGSSEPRPATLTINADGKITSVLDGWRTRDLTSDHTNWIDAQDNVVIPGLVEYVTATRRRNPFNVGPVPMSISMSLAVPTGKDSGREREQVSS